MKTLIQETVVILEWMIADMKWRADETKQNFEEGSEGGYSPELTKAIELYKKWKSLC